MRWGFWIRRYGRRLRRRLGLPALSRRTALLILLFFLGLIWVAVTLMADFFMKTGRYGPRYYEPKDFQREEHIEQLEQMEKLKKRSF